MKSLSALAVFASALASSAVVAAEPDGLVLPAGFHATVVAEALGPVRHLVVRDNGDIYISTPLDKQGKGGGIIALRLGADHKATQTEHFGSVHDGTGIRFHHGALYAASPSTIYRFKFRGKELVPSGDPEIVVDGMPARKGPGATNRIIAVDGKGGLYVAVNAVGNICADPNAPKDAVPVGLRPCPILEAAGGIWRFKAGKLGQKFPADGERLATGLRDLTALDWSPADGNVYGIMHGRDGTSKSRPDVLSDSDDANIADEMHRVTKGTDFGWPFTYYDGVRKLRVVSPEYGGDGKATPTSGSYSTPVVTWQARRPAPVDLVFYTGKKFPVTYRRGAFVVLHGTGAHNGYNIVFIPFNRSGKAGEAMVFASGFEGTDPPNESPTTARYRPMGVAVGPDGALYVTDSQKGRVWRIAYDDHSTDRGRG